MNLYYLYIPIVLIMILPCVAEIFKARSYKRSRMIRDYYTVSERCARILSAATPDTVYRYIKEYKTAYATVEKFLKKKEQDFFHEDILELEEYLSDLEWNRWEKRARPHLQTFWDCYNSLQEGAFLQKDATRYKKICINEWQAYYRLPLEQYHTRITPKKYFKEYLEEDYDDCMDDHYTLERRLDKFIRDAKA